MKSRAKVHQEKFMVKCLACKKTVDVGINPKVGKFITCKNCDMVFEIIDINPVILDWPYYDDDDDYDDDYDGIDDD